MEKFIRKCIHIFGSWQCILFFAAVSGLTYIVNNSAYLNETAKILLCFIINCIQIVGVIFMILNLYITRHVYGIVGWYYIIVLIIIAVWLMYTNITTLYPLLL